MSADATAHVWKHSPYRGKDFVVHLAIADVVNDTHGWEFFGGIRVLSEKSRSTRKTVIESLSKMVEEGHLEKLGTSSVGTSTYRFLFVEGGCNHYTPGVIPSARGCNPRVPVLLPTKRELNTRVARSEDDSEPSPLRGFVEFWNVYPKRNGRRLGRGACEKRWTKLSLEERRAAWRGAVNYGRDVEKALQIAKDPDRWLRDRLWTDWQESTAPVSVPGELSFDPDAPNPVWDA